MSAAASLVWAPAAPAIAFVLLTIGVGRRFAATLATTSIVLSLAASVAALLAVWRGDGSVVAFPWLTIGVLRAEISIDASPLTAFVATLVSFVATAVFVYASAYMRNDPRRARFFTILTLFAAAMLSLVAAGDLLMLFVAWEIVGACSFLLISFWFDKPGAAPAGTKAFVTTRIGDLALLAGILLLVIERGDSRIASIITSPSPALVAMLLILVGAASKSAQIPFQSWLPDAMAGPAPVSALLHSATMVAAGAFLIARLHPLFVASPPVLSLIAWIGVATSLLGGAVALVQEDLKRTLAYSSMSQLGLMFAGLGSGSLFAGVVLLFAHALYKANLFLVAGAVDHAAGGTRFERMGGLARVMPVPFVAFAISAVALAGLPVTFALPAKEEVMAAAYHTDRALFSALVVAAFLTALYSTRMVVLVFLGERRSSDPLHQPGRGLQFPIAFLSGALLTGLLVDSQLLGRPLRKLLNAPLEENSGVTTLAIAVALAGVAAAALAHRRWPRAIVWPPLRPIAALLNREFGFRPFYDHAATSMRKLAGAADALDRRILDRIAFPVARGVLATTHFLWRFDRASFDRIASAVANRTLGLIRLLERADRAAFDRIATGAANGTLRVIQALRTIDLAAIDRAFSGLGEGILTAGERTRPIQTGRIENYLLAALTWAIALIAVAAAATLF